MQELTSKSPLKELITRERFEKHGELECFVRCERALSNHRFVMKTTDGSPGIGFGFEAAVIEHLKSITAVKLLRSRNFSHGSLRGLNVVLAGEGFDAIE